MLRICLLLFLILLGCNNNVKTYTKVEHQNKISLYPGYLAKSKGVIRWFPQIPEYDDNLNDWAGENSVPVSSCIADPWPYTEGNKASLLKVE